RSRLPALLQPLQRSDDEIGALVHVPARGIEDQIVLVELCGILEEVVLDETDALSVGCFDPVCGFLGGDAETLARRRDAILQHADEADTQRVWRRQDLGSSPA